MNAIVLEVPSEDALYELLQGLNISGEPAELPCSSGKGGAFLATLTEPDAGTAHIVSTEVDSGRVHCCECSHPNEPTSEHDPNRWKPAYPVVALVTVLPDLQQCMDDGIDAWWAAPPTDDREALERWLGE